MTVDEDGAASPFFVIETDKKVYYPGDIMEISVSLRVKDEPLFHVDSLVVNIKGTESF